MFRIVVIVLVLLVAGVAYSQQPSQDLNTGIPKQDGTPINSPPKSTPNNSDSTANKKKTKPPISVKIIEPEYRNKAAEQDDTYKKQNLEIQERITGYTRILAVVAAVQVALFVIQLYWLREGLAVSRRSAEAALVMAQAMSLSERAYVFAKVEVVDEKIITTDGEMGIANVRALFVNHGKTPAIIVNMSGVACFTDDVPQELPPTPVDDRELPEGLVIASELGFNLPIVLNLTNQDLKDINTGTRKLYCAGFIKYKDILGNERETGYCWEYIPLPRKVRRFKFCAESRLNHYT